MKPDAHVRLLTSFREVRELEAEWRELWRRCPDLTIFQSPDWLIPWIEVFSPYRLWVLEARCGRDLVALAPLFIYGTEGDRIVVPLGAGISDYLDLLVDPKAPEALNGLAEFLRVHSREWTEVRFPDLRKSSPLLRSDFLAEFNSENFGRVEAQVCEVCPQLSLPASIDELRGSVPAKQLRNLRAARRRLDGAEIELATPATLEEFLAALFRLHEKRWRRSGEAGVLAEPLVREFYRRVAPRMLESKMLRMFGLRYRGELIACLMAFSDRDSMRLYLQGYDPEWAQGSPGAQLVGASLEQAIREQKPTADFMRGREPYKYYWGCRDVPTFQLKIRAHGWTASSCSEKSVA